MIRALRLVFLGSILAGSPLVAETVQLLNASYDPTRVETRPRRESTSPNSTGTCRFWMQARVGRPSRLHNDQKHTREEATAYLQFLYTPEAQEIAARNFYRPLSPELLAKYASQFPQIPVFTVDDVYGGWTKAQSQFFDDGGVFDQIYQR